MVAPLTPSQLRILGVLIEKQFATPEYYPLTLNALLAGCNQKSNRDPVVHLAEPEVSKALRELCLRDLAREVHDPSGRVPRYGHRVNAVLGIDGSQAAILCELMLRGPQTAGELRGRASRLSRFESPEEVEAILKALAEREAPLVLLLERQPGTRERRWAHLLAGRPVQAAGPALDAEEKNEEPPPSSRFSRAPELKPSASEASDKIEHLEQEVVALRKEIADLGAAFERFRRQFE